MPRQRVTVLLVALIFLGGFGTLLFKYSPIGSAVVSSIQSVFAKKLPGTVVFEAGSILIAGSAQSREFAPLVPDASVTPFLSRNTLAPNKLWGVATRYSQNLVEVVLFSPGGTQSPRILQEHSLLTTAPFDYIRYPVWSADSNHLAYLFSPPAPEFLITPDGEPFATLNPTEGFLVENFGLLPEEYRSSIFIVANGEEPRILPSGIPIAFSPDSRRLLVQVGTELALLTIDSGELVPLSGAPTLQRESTLPTQVRSVPGGSYLLLWTPLKEATFYTIDWDTASFSALGTLPKAERIKEVLFDSSTGNQVLTLATNGDERRFDVYRVGEDIVHTASYKINLPEDFVLLQWFSQ